MRNRSFRHSGAVIILKNPSDRRAKLPFKKSNQSIQLITDSTPDAGYPSVIWQVTPDARKGVEVIPTGVNVPKPAYDGNVSSKQSIWYQQFAPGEILILMLRITIPRTEAWKRISIDAIYRMANGN